MPKVVNLESQIEGGKDGKLEYNEADQPFTDPDERASRVEGYGPYGIAQLPNDTDSDEPGFLENNNVRDRI
jgi:hypothetical protein